MGIQDVCVKNDRDTGPGGGGVLPYITIWVCAAQQDRDFEAPDLEQGIYFRGIF